MLLELAGGEHHPVPLMLLSVARHRNNPRRAHRNQEEHPFLLSDPQHPLLIKLNILTEKKWVQVELQYQSMEKKAEFGAERQYIDSWHAHKCVAVV